MGTPVPTLFDLSGQAALVTGGSRCLGRVEILVNNAGAIWGAPAEDCPLAAGAPLKRLGDDDDLKGAVLLCASAAGKHIAGQLLAVDGGVSAVHGA